MTTLYAADTAPTRDPYAREQRGDRHDGGGHLWRNRRLRFGPGRFAPGTLFGLNVRVSKTIPAAAVVDASAFGKLYMSPICLATSRRPPGRPTARRPARRPRSVRHRARHRGRQDRGR